MGTEVGLRIMYDPDIFEERPWIREYLPDIVADPRLRDANARLWGMVKSLGNTLSRPFIVRQPEMFDPNLRRMRCMWIVYCVHKDNPFLIAAWFNLELDAQDRPVLDDMALAEKVWALSPRNLSAAELARIYSKQVAQQAVDDDKKREELAGQALDVNFEAVTCHPDHPEYREFLQVHRMGGPVATVGATLTP